MAKTIEAGFNILTSTQPPNAPAASITLDSSITAPVIVSTVLINTNTIIIGESSSIVSQNISTIGPALVQSNESSTRLLMPVINSDNTVNLAEIYYIYNTDLPQLNFSAVLKVLGI